MDSSIEAALTDELVVRAFVAFDIQFANARVCLSDGLPEVSFVVTGNSITFNNFDEDYGVITGIQSWTDGATDQAPTTTLTLMVSNSAIMPIVEDPLNQSKPVNIYFGLVDDVSGAVIGDPELIYAGLIDVATLKSTSQTRSYDITIISAWEKFFNADKGQRLNLRYQKQIHPNEDGLKYMVSTLDPIWWGSGEITGTKSKTPSSALANRLNNAN